MFAIVHDHLKETNQAISGIEAMGLAKVRNTAARVSIQHLEKLGYMKRVGGTIPWSLQI
jgi:hypothetical protein